MRIDVKEIINVLEVAIGETNATNPDKILEATIYYLNDYEKLKNYLSWDCCPELMGQR